MAVANFTNTGIKSKESQAAIKAANPDNFNVVVNTRMWRPPLEMIYLWTVARRDEKVSHWAFPGTLKGCTNGERYVLSGQVSHPTLQACPDLERGATRTDEHDGWRVAIDILNPANTTDDPWIDTRGMSMSRGANLIAKGFFPSRNNPPSEAELQKAESLRNTWYEGLTREAIRLESTSTRELNDFLRERPEVHEAMDALGLQAAWHKSREVKATCPNCGDSIKSGVAFHQSSAGVLCVLDPERALKAGAINKERYRELTEKS